MRILSRAVAFSLIVGLGSQWALAGVARPGGVGAGGLAGGGARAAQPVGFGGAGGAGGGLGGGGGAAFNVAPEKFGLVNVLAEKTSQVRVACVCMQHGAPDPAPQIPYEIMPIEQYSTDAVLQELIKAFGRGDLNQRAAQAATWHVANNLSWDDLANKQIKHINRPSEPYFSKAEVLFAMQYVAESEKLVKERPVTSAGEQPQSANEPAKKTAVAAEPVAAVKDKVAKEKTGETINLFDAIKNGQVEAKFIPSSDHEAKLLITNKTKDALIVKLPDGMAGRPIVKN